MPSALKIPIIDLSSPDRLSTAALIRQACLDVGFFYVVNYGVDKDFIEGFLSEGKKFFSLPLEEKMKLERNELSGYSPLCVENLDPLSNPKGGSKEAFDIDPLNNYADSKNQWPSEDILPGWRAAVESYFNTAMKAALKLLSLVALSLNLEENYFEKVGALDAPIPDLRFLHYPGDLGSSNEKVYGAGAHSDFGMITLLATDGVPGLQVCREKDNHPRVWEDVPHVDGAVVCNIGDMMERWTNCQYRSTMHRVVPTGRERYSAGVFLNPSRDCLVECMKTCCSESCPPRFPPIRSADYLRERYMQTYVELGM